MPLRSWDQRWRETHRQRERQEGKQIETEDKTQRTTETERLREPTESQTSYNSVLDMTHHHSSLSILGSQSQGAASSGGAHTEMCDLEAGTGGACGAAHHTAADEAVGPKSKHNGSPWKVLCQRACCWNFISSPPSWDTGRRAVRGPGARADPDCGHCVLSSNSTHVITLSSHLHPSHVTPAQGFQTLQVFIVMMTACEVDARMTRTVHMGTFRGGPERTCLSGSHH